MTLKITASWDPNPPGVKAPELAATWGTCEISVQGSPITLVEDVSTGLPRRYVIGSLYPLAEWIAYNWWFLRYDYRAAEPVFSADEGFARWSSRHNVSQAGDGFAWPSLWIEPLGSSSLLRWDSNDGNGRVRFVSSGRARVVADELMETLARFVDQVVDRLAQDGIDGTPLHVEWNAIREADKDESEFCRSAASLGLDPFDMDPAISAAMIEAHDLLEGTDFDVLMSSARPSRLAQDVEWIRKAEVKLSESPADSSILPGLRLLRATSRRPWSTMPWKIGYETASAVRSHLHMTIDEKIELDSYAPISFLESPDPGLVALAGCWNTHSSLVLGGRRGDAGERFVQARSIWRFINQESDNRRMLIGQGRTSFEQAERAFAAELLAPAEAIRHRLVEGLSDSEGIAERFGVSVAVIDNQIENQLTRW